MLTLFSASVVLAGCGSRGSGPNPQHAHHIKTLAILYARYVGSHKGSPPPNEAVFKKFIESIDSGQAAALKLNQNDLTEAFTSPRDKEPYVIRYNVMFGPPQPNSPGTVIIYEKTGVHGKRLVVYSNSKTEEVDEARFRQLLPG